MFEGDKEIHDLMKIQDSSSFSNNLCCVLHYISPRPAQEDYFIIGAHSKYQLTEDSMELELMFMFANQSGLSGLAKLWNVIRDELKNSEVNNRE